MVGLIYRSSTDMFTRSYRLIGGSAIFYITITATVRLPKSANNSAPALPDKRTGRGAAFGDIDNDGDVDLGD